MPPKILIVEDHENTRESLQQFLSMAKYQVVAAPDRNRAHAEIESQPFDAALIDLRMPTQRLYATIPMGISSPTRRSMRNWRGFTRPHNVPIIR